MDSSATVSNFILTPDGELVPTNDNKEFIDNKEVINNIDTGMHAISFNEQIKQVNEKEETDVVNKKKTVDEKENIPKKRHVGRPTKVESDYYKMKKELADKQIEEMKTIQSLVKVLDTGVISIEEFGHEIATKARMLNNM